MVYASQCANFPRPVDYAPSSVSRSTIASPVSSTTSFLSPTSPPAMSSFTHPALTRPTLLPSFENATVPQEESGRHSIEPATTSGNDSSTSTVRSPLPAIVEEASTPPSRVEMQESTPFAPPRSSPPSSQQMSTSSFTSARSDDPLRQQNALLHVVDLPMAHLTIPYPSCMALVHGWLYSPSPPILLASLLDLPRPDVEQRQASTLPPVSSRIASLPVHAILDRLQRIHKLWSNVVALGISDPTLWKVMDRAWDTLVAVLKERGGEAVHELSLKAGGRVEEGMSAHSEVVRKFSMATIRDPRSRAGSADTLSS